MNSYAEYVIRRIESKDITLNEEEKNKIKSDEALAGSLENLINTCQATSPNSINDIARIIKETIREFNTKQYNQNNRAMLAAEDRRAAAIEIQRAFRKSMKKRQQAAKGGKRKTCKSHRKSHRKTHRKTYRRHRK